MDIIKFLEERYGVTLNEDEDLFNDCSTTWDRIIDLARDLYDRGYADGRQSAQPERKEEK